MILQGPDMLKLRDGDVATLLTGAIAGVEDAVDDAGKGKGDNEIVGNHVSEDWSEREISSRGNPRGRWAILINRTHFQRVVKFLS